MNEKSIQTKGNKVIDRKRLPVLLLFVAAFLILIVLYVLRPKPEQQVEPALTPVQTQASSPLPSPPAVATATAPVVLPLVPTHTLLASPAAARTPTVTAVPTAANIPGNVPEAVTPEVPIQPLAPRPTPTASTVPIPATGSSFFVAPDGSAQGDGSINHPWDIETALNNPPEVKPGATVWLRGGQYGTGGATRYTSSLQGSESQPIVVRGYPGERAIVDAGILAKGAWTWFWGFEITNTDTNRTSTAYARPPGLYLQGRGQKAINMIIYNTGHPGIGFWSEVGDGGEVYGCLIWGVGTFDTDKASWMDGRGSAIYAQNQTGTHLIEDVISFRNLTTGMKAYAEKGYVNNFTFEGNISFENGDRLIFVNGTEFPAQNVVIKDNYTYRSPYEPNPPVRLGYADVDQGGALVTGNVFVNGVSGDGAFWVKRFSSLTFTDNELVSPNVLATYLPAVNVGQIIWNNNHYFGGSFAPFRMGRIPYPFLLWQKITSFDADSTYTNKMPPGQQVFVRPNRYDPNRANIAIYNWAMSSAVKVDLSKVLKTGDTFHIQDAQDYFGAPVVEGVYDGSPVLVPMNLSQVSTITGDGMPIANQHTSAQFGAYVVLIDAHQP